MPGLIGVGLPRLESTATFGFFGGGVYLYNQRYTKSPSYSLYLDDIPAQSGSVLFGGVDHAKCQGQLYTLPRTSILNYEIRIDRITTGTFRARPILAVSDSGTSLGLLPNRILRGLAEQLSLSYNENDRYYYLEKNKRFQDADISLAFSGISHTLKLSNLLLQGDLLGEGFKNNYHVFGFLSSEENSNSIILGDVFLRNFYVVYDAAHPQIGIARASYKKSDTHVQAIIGNSIPKAKQAPEFN